MAQKSEIVPYYMEQLLNELGWNEGTRIPLANAENQVLENLLIERQNEIQQLKESLTAQRQKQKDLNKYKDNVHTEYQENTRLLFALKQQLEQEVKIRQLALNEADRLDRDIRNCVKESKAINERVEQIQIKISKMLKKADELKTEVCGERGAVAEWRATLPRFEHDIEAIEKFNKQDTSKAKALETKRQQLKVEHDRYENRLIQLVADIDSEERALERVCNQVMESMQERNQIMTMWANAVENLRQRDNDIRHVKEDYKVLEAEANKIAEKCREQQAFAEQQRANNVEVEKEIEDLAYKLSQFRLMYQSLLNTNITLESEQHSLWRELQTVQKMLEAAHIRNRTIKEDHIKHQATIEKLKIKIKEVKVKVEDSLDKTKSSEKRAKELEEMLNEEQKYASVLTLQQQRAMHCSFVEQKKLLALQNEEKLFKMHFKSTKAIISKLEAKKIGIEKQLQVQKEELYAICYQTESIGARILDMEGKLSETQYSAELVIRENRLKEVLARHSARVVVLEKHSSRLQDDMRQLSKGLEARGAEHARLTTTLKMFMLRVEGFTKELKDSRDQWRTERVEEALTKLKLAHGERALAGLDDTNYTLEVQRLNLDAAMQERMTEIKARCDVFKVQRRTLKEECSELRVSISERQRRVTQLIHRYDIFIASLGKDEHGQTVSVTFFKIKFAAERAELRERGASLDTDITRREKEVSALEATLRVVAAAHNHFMRTVLPIEQDAPEIEELNNINKQYYEYRDELKIVKAEVDEYEQKVSDVSTKLTTLSDKNKQLAARQSEAECELEGARERAAKQEVKLQNAKDVVRHYRRRARKLFRDVDEWRIFQMSIWLRDYDEGAQNAIQALTELSKIAPEAYKQFASLVCTTDIEKYVSKHQKRLASMIHRIITSKIVTKEQMQSIPSPLSESVFSSSKVSSHSGVSVASGYMQRLTVFRKQLAEKIDEKALVDEIPEVARRSTVSLRIVNVDLCDRQGKSQVKK